MPVETAADREGFYNTDEFGCEVSYTPVGGGSTTVIAGIWDSNTVLIDTESQVGVQSRAPTFMCRVDDVTSGGKYGDQIVVTQAQLLAAGLDPDPAGTYLVKVIEPDGTGMVTLILEKQT